MGDEEKEESEEDEYSMKKEIAKFDLPPGRQEHQNLTEHTICLAYQTMNRGCFLKALIFEKVKQCLLHIAEKVLFRYGTRVGVTNTTRGHDIRYTTVSPGALKRSTDLDLLLGKMSSVLITDEYCLAITSNLAFICDVSYRRGQTYL